MLTILDIFRLVDYAVDEEQEEGKTGMGRRREREGGRVGGGGRGARRDSAGTQQAPGGARRHQEAPRKREAALEVTTVKTNALHSA